MDLQLQIFSAIKKVIMWFYRLFSGYYLCYLFKINNYSFNVGI